MRATLLLVPLLTVACGEKGPDLPAGWEAATPLVDFGQTACDGDPLQDPDRTQDINVNVQSGAARLTWTNAIFRCEQDVEAFLRRSGSRVDLLVQPVDLMPEEVARCDCYYDLDAGFNLSDSETTVGFYVRRDEVGGPSSPSEIGTITF